MKPPFLSVLKLLLLSLAVSACAPAASPIAVPLPATEASAPVEPMLLSTAILAPTSLPEAAPTETRFVGSGGQFATDPATVELAAGRPTLVKFFAFW